MRQFPGEQAGLHAAGDFQLAANRALRAFEPHGGAVKLAQKAHALLLLLCDARFEACDPAIGLLGRRAATLVGPVW
jgi:hypothetical protein